MYTHMTGKSLITGEWSVRVSGGGGRRGGGEGEGQTMAV